MDVRDLWKDYCEEQCVKNLGEKLLSYAEFAGLFKNAFPRVHIREYKHVAGKCDVCERCKSMMRSIKLPHEREIIRAYRAMHRYVSPIHILPFCIVIYFLSFTH